MKSKFLLMLVLGIFIIAALPAAEAATKNVKVLGKTVLEHCNGVRSGECPLIIQPHLFTMGKVAGSRGFGHGA